MRVRIPNIHTHDRFSSEIIWIVCTWWSKYDLRSNQLVNKIYFSRGLVYHMNKAFLVLVPNSTILGAKDRTCVGVCPSSSRSGLVSASGCSDGSSYTIWFKTWHFIIVRSELQQVSNVMLLNRRTILVFYFSGLDLLFFVHTINEVSYNNWATL